MDFLNGSARGSTHQKNGKNGHADPGHLPHVDLAFQDHALPPNLVGSELCNSDFAGLQARWIDQPLAQAAFLRRVDSFTGGQLVGRRGGEYAGIAIPYFAPGSRHVREYRLRRDHPDFEADANGDLKVKQKYLSPPGRGNMLYFPPGCDHVALTNAELPLIITKVSSRRWRSRAWPVGRMLMPIVFFRSGLPASLTGEA